MVIVKSFIFILFLLGVMHSEQEDKNIEKLSEFFIELIARYDTNGSGFISRKDYPHFIRDIFIEGSQISDEKTQLASLLEKAATEFTEEKDKEKQQIGIQEFYDDIISRFTLFLMEKEEYSDIISELYEDIKEKSEDDDSEKEGVQL